MDIVVQGPVYEDSTHLLIQGLKLARRHNGFIDKIILSTWEGNDYDDSEIIIIKSKDLDNPGVHNRNRQIYSTQEGLKLVDSSVCAKFRSDIIFPPSTLAIMNRFYNEYEDGLKIFCLGLYRKFPFHPRDHVFWGPTDKVKLLFDIPLDSRGMDNGLWPEAWLGCYYAARYSPRLKEMLFEKDGSTKYLAEWAPNVNEAFEIHKEWYEKLFWPFPREGMWYNWPKVGLWSGYYFDYAQNFATEYWFEDM